MRSLTLTATLVALLIAAPITGASADADRSDDNVYQIGARAEGATTAFSVTNPVARSVDSAVIPATDRSDNRR